MPEDARPKDAKSEDALTEDAGRLRQLLDRCEITELKHAFARAADDGDYDRMVECFLPDCTASYQPGQLLEGRDALRDWYAHRLIGVVASSHHVSNVEISFIDHDSAVLRAYLYSWQRFSDFPRRADRHCWARYLDTWVRTPQGWLQSSLIYLLAGEVTSDAPPRVGEHLIHAGWRASVLAPPR